jgi:hypothetical protein
MLVRVFGNTYLNPDAVGKLEFFPASSENDRTSLTVVHDMTGQHVLREFSTTVSTTEEARKRDPLALRRDNFCHVEIRAALHEKRDARDWEALTDDEINH